MFGIDVNGLSVAKHLFLRTNPERKRPGPVTIRIDATIVANHLNKIFIEDKEVSSPKMLQNYIDILESTFNDKRKKSPQSTIDVNPKVTGVQSLIRHSRSPGKLLSFIEKQKRSASPPHPFNEEKWNLYLKSIFRWEVINMLRETEIFNQQQLIQQQKLLRNNTTLQKYAGNKNYALSSEIDVSLSKHNWLGFAENEDYSIRLLKFLEKKPLTIAVPVYLTASYVLPALPSINERIKYKGRFSLQAITRCRHRDNA